LGAFECRFRRESTVTGWFGIREAEGTTGRLVDDEDAEEEVVARKGGALGDGCIEGGNGSRSRVGVAFRAAVLTLMMRERNYRADAWVERKKEDEC
jgi:hypothetical protein